MQLLMKMLCWSVRGIGGSGKDSAIKKLVSKVKPIVLGLVETKHSTVSDTKLRNWWGDNDYG